LRRPRTATMNRRSLLNLPVQPAGTDLSRRLSGERRNVPGRRKRRTLRSSCHAQTANDVPRSAIQRFTNRTAEQNAWSRSIGRVNPRPSFRNPRSVFRIFTRAPIPKRSRNLVRPSPFHPPGLGPGLLSSSPGVRASISPPISALSESLSACSSEKSSVQSLF
jgi:hypothetical protein